MNHDYAHCLDYRPDCPKSCFRAQLERDLAKRKDIYWLPITYQHFQDTEECERDKDANSF